MFYYAVDLYGTPTEAKTELTSQFQWIHEYYMGCNTDGSGPDQYADHHIVIRSDDEDKLMEALFDIHKKYNCQTFFYEVSTEYVLGVSDHKVIDIFTRDYADNTVKPVPYTFTPIEEPEPEPEV